MKNFEIDIKANIDRVRNAIFIYTLPLAALAIIFDIIFIESEKYVLTINITNLILLAVSFILFLTKKIDVRHNYVIVIYALIANIIVTNIFEIRNNQSIILFMRDSLSVFILMPLASIVIGKFQNLIIGGIYILVYVFIAFYTQNNFLVSNIIWTVSVFGGFSVCMFLFIRIVEITVSKQEKLTSKVILQNRELFTQANNLEEINKLLNQQAIEIKSQQKELQKLNSTKDKLFSLIAHDLKTPMNSIIGLLEIMELKFDTMPEEKKKKYVQLIKAASVNTYALLENLLEWSISQTKNIECTPKKLRIGFLFNQISDLLGQAARNKKVMLNIKYDENYEVMADEHMIVTVIRNLVSNGIKYTGENGTVTIKAERVENKIKISVIDTGVGIPSDNIEKLFKIENTSSTRGTSGESGTGLGLIISNDFLSKHGSQLKVSSETNIGTEFSFLLPLAV